MAEQERLHSRHAKPRVRDGGVARHGRAAGTESFAASFTALGTLAYEGAEVSAHVIDLPSDTVLLAIDDRIVLPTAGVGSLLLLVEASARMTVVDTSVLVPASRPTASTPPHPTPAAQPGDTGLWRHLQPQSLAIADLAVLVASTGDTLASNALLERIGLDAVRARTEGLGMARTALLDSFRSDRGPDDAPYPSVGSAYELARLLADLTRGQAVDPVSSERVLGWMALNYDLSMVASAFGLDPLSHSRADHGIHLVNKTGSDRGIRCEVGAVRGPTSSIAYAVSVRFADESLAGRLHVIEAMRDVGRDILRHVR